jgi:hypothetical protein
LGTFLGRFAFGHVRQLDAVTAGLLARLAHTSTALPAVDTVVLVDLDDTEGPTGSTPCSLSCPLRSRHR